MKLNGFFACRIVLIDLIVQEILPYFAWWMYRKFCLILHGGCARNLALFCMVDVQEILPYFAC